MQTQEGMKKNKNEGMTLTIKYHKTRTPRTKWYKRIQKAIVLSGRGKRFMKQYHTCPYYMKNQIFLKNYVEKILVV